MKTKLIETLPPTKALPPMFIFGEGGPCGKGETAAKTGCTPSSGKGGGKKAKKEAAWAEVDKIEDAASKMDIDADLREEVLKDLFTGMGSTSDGAPQPSAEDFEDSIETYKEQVSGFAGRLDKLKKEDDGSGGTAAAITSMESAIEMEEEKIDAVGKLKEAAGFGGSQATSAEEAPSGGGEIGGGSVDQDLLNEVVSDAKESIQIGSNGEMVATVNVRGGIADVRFSPETTKSQMEERVSNALNSLDKRAADDQGVEGGYDLEKSAKAANREGLRVVLEKWHEETGGLVSTGSPGRGGDLEMVSWDVKDLLSSSGG